MHINHSLKGAQTDLHCVSSEGIL